jgi:cellulose 1,4-beta-cellobiosidase
MSAAFTPHPCTNSAQHMCSGDSCGGTYSAERYAGDCDPDGCDWNAFRMGNKDFYGPSKKVDTTKKFTVVTQFTSSEIRQYYVQNGVKIMQPNSTVSGLTGYNSITESMCKAQKTAFGDQNVFDQKGGLSGMNSALGKGMVLVMSLWDDVS